MYSDDDVHDAAAFPNTNLEKHLQKVRFFFFRAFQVLPVLVSIDRSIEDHHHGDRLIKLLHVTSCRSSPKICYSSRTLESLQLAGNLW